jgi:hypothetical protein
MRLILAEYYCEADGRFDSLEERTADGEAPDHATCPECGELAPWTISAPMGKVRVAEVVRGKSDKPERKGWLDTRELGEGMPLEEYRAKRAKIREEERHRDLKEFLSS